MEDITNQLIEELGRIYKEKNEVTDEILTALSFVCGPTLLPALDLVDKEHVTKLTSPSGRSLYQVIGSSGVPYTCFSACLYCSCQAYKFAVLKRQDALMCKHLLAILISRVVSSIKEQAISDEELASAIRCMD